MRFSIDVGSELQLKLYQAVLLYRNDHGNRHMATVHGVVQKETDGTPLLGSGQLLSTAALRELTKQLGVSQHLQILGALKNGFTKGTRGRILPQTEHLLPIAIRCGATFFRSACLTVHKDVAPLAPTEKESWEVGGCRLNASKERALAGQRSNQLNYDPAC